MRLRTVSSGHLRESDFLNVLRTRVAIDQERHHFSGILLQVKPDHVAIELVGLGCGGALAFLSMSFALEPVGLLGLSSCVTNPIGRFGGSGGVVSSRTASSSWRNCSRVLRLKVPAI